MESMAFLCEVRHAGTRGFSVPTREVVVMTGSQFCQEPCVYLPGPGQIRGDAGRSKIEAHGRLSYKY